jgi:ElaB/YqjD/DUF883 family membrane-anchored ribosome-binding protein
MAWNRAARTVVALCVVLTAAVGCESSGEPGTAGPSPATASAGSSAAASGSSRREECTAVLAAGSAFASALNRFADGQGTLEELRSTADQLVEVGREAGTAVGDAWDRALADLEQRLAELRSALQQRPPQPDQVRAAGRAVVDALAAFARPCITPTPGTSS